MAGWLAIVFVDGGSELDQFSGCGA